jgi:hypothetical protein
LPAQGKARVPSGEQAATAATDSEVSDSGVRASEVFRRAMDPLKGVDIDDLFEQPSNSGGNAAASPAQLATTQSDIGNAERSPWAPPNSPSAIPPGSPPAPAAQTPPSMPSSANPLPLSRQNQNIRQLEARPQLVTPGRIAIVAAILLGVFVVNALPNLLKHQQPQAPIATPQPVEETPKQTAVTTTTTNTGAGEIKEKEPEKEKPPAHTAKPVEHNDHTTSHTASHPPVHKPHVAPKPHVTAAVKHAPAAVSAPAHSSSASNPWAALQGLRPKK